MDLATLRAAASAVALALAALVGIPVQKLSLALKLGLARKIPILFHRFALGVLGVRVRRVGRPAAERPLLIASNHVTWLDIPVLSIADPVSFVAKAEIADWPGFGTLARLQRSIFIDRTRKTATGAASQAMAERMAEGDAVVLFAEGTSGDGNRVLPFRSALLGAVREAIASGGAARVAVQPVSIAYTRRSGLPLGRRERSQVAWYGDIDFLPHLWSVLRDGAIDVTVTYGTPVAVEAGTDRKALTRDLEAEVRRLTSATLRDPTAVPVLAPLPEKT